VFTPAAKVAEGSDVVAAMGGDGTILRAAALVEAHERPVLGVNLGRLNFLTDAAPQELDTILDRLVRGDYGIEKRLAIEARVGPTRAFALNEIVIEKTVLARMVQVKAWVGEAEVSSFFGNGLIVSTPTGSTAYSLSAGGPVVHPSIEALVVTPVCAHSLSLRPLIVPADQTVSVQVTAEAEEAMLTADGRTVMDIGRGDRVTVRRAPRPILLINLQGASFYQLLRRKLDWSVESREPRGA
jgi:NAD+ kinase